jgi:acyl-[acyl-carrier-protein]-phospholipid O-acyltransferase/long-chain-fatty-acid--[acyl-carrier-protein] ligase
MKFFIEHEQEHYPWMKRLYHLLRVVFIPDVEPLVKNKECQEAILTALRKGMSVCVFVQSWDVYAEVEKLHQTEPFNHFLEAAHFPLIPVRIEKGAHQIRFSYLKRVMKRFRVPAAVSFGKMVYAGHQAVIEARHEHELCFEET